MSKTISSRPQTVHSAIIDQLAEQYPQSQRLGFTKTIRALQKRIGIDVDERWLEMIQPDLWFLDEECMSVFCLEVEDSSRLSVEKLESYQRLWFILDCYNWETHLICISRWAAMAAIPLFRRCLPEDRDKNRTMFDLSEVYCIKDPAKRKVARLAWIAENPEFVKANFYGELRLERRMISGPVRSRYTAT